MLLARVAQTSNEVAATRARSTKVALIASCLREAEPTEVRTVVAYLAGDLPQRRTGVGWASLRALPAPAALPATERLLELAVDRKNWVVHVRPELVVEVAFDGVQRSTRYAGGVTLRFARVLRYPPDKRPDDADDIESVRAIFAG